MNFNTELAGASLNMLMGLVIVMGIILALWYFARRFMQKNLGVHPGKRIRVLAQSCIGLKKSISLVQVPGSILVLGVTQDRITCLTTLQPEDWEEEIQEIDTRPPATSFISQLKNEMTGIYKK